MALNVVLSGTGWPAISIEKSGVSVSPVTAIRSSTPVYSPWEERVPSSPLMVFMSALVKVYFPRTGVVLGSSEFHGPKTPVVAMRPWGVGLVSEARKLAPSFCPYSKICRS